MTAILLSREFESITQQVNHIQALAEHPCYCCLDSLQELLCVIWSLLGSFVLNLRVDQGYNIMYSSSPYKFKNLVHYYDYQE